MIDYSIYPRQVFIPKSKPLHLFKVLNTNNRSPYQNVLYKEGEIVTCPKLNRDVNSDCDCGIYATDIDGLPYCYNTNRKVFECEVWGHGIEFDQFKRRYKNLKLGHEISKSELVEIAKSWDSKVGYKLSEVMNPINPFDIVCTEITQKHLDLLKECSSVGNSVCSSVGNSVCSSVWNSVGNSVRDSVGNSVWDSVWDSVNAYCGSLFPNITSWKYSGVYPFQCFVDLWKQGLIPCELNGKWKLHQCNKG